MRAAFLSGLARRARPRARRARGETGARRFRGRRTLDSGVAGERHRIDRSRAGAGADPAGARASSRSRDPGAVAVLRVPTHRPFHRPLSPAAVFRRRCGDSARRRGDARGLGTDHAPRNGSHADVVARCREDGWMSSWCGSHPPDARSPPPPRLLVCARDRSRLGSASANGRDGALGFVTRRLEILEPDGARRVLDSSATITHIYSAQEPLGRDRRGRADGAAQAALSRSRRFRTRSGRRLDPRRWLVGTSRAGGLLRPCSALECRGLRRMVARVLWDIPLVGRRGRRRGRPLGSRRRPA